MLWIQPAHAINDDARIAQEENKCPRLEEHTPEILPGLFCAL
jgi:hypothetical protein